MPTHSDSKLNNAPAKQLVQQLVQTAVKRLNLVTREEFEIQLQVLRKTRLMVEALERKLMELHAEQLK